MRMRTVFMAAAVALALSPTEAQAGHYNLSQLLERVRNEYAGVEAAREAKNVAEAQLSQANRLWFPTGDLTFGLTGTPKVQCLDANRSPNVNDCVRTDVVDLSHGSRNAFSFDGVALRFDAKLTQPLYTFGKIEAARAAAKAGRDAADGGVAQAKAEVSVQAQRAYWGLKWARASLATLDDGRGRLSDWVKRVDAAIEGGKSSYTETDLIRLKLALDTAELVILDVERAKQIAESALRVLTHDDQVELDDSEIELVAGEMRPLAFYQDGALTHRPEARMLSAAGRAVHAQRSLRIAELLPDIGVQASFGYGYAQNVDTPQNAFMNHPNTVGAGVYLVARTTLDIPERLAKFSEANAQLRQLDAKRREALGGIALEIDRSYADAIEAQKRADRSAHAEKIARGWYNAVDSNLQAGVAESRDLVDAARNYFELRLKHLQAIMDVNVTHAALERAAGL